MFHPWPVPEPMLRRTHYDMPPQPRIVHGMATTLAFCIFGEGGGPALEERAREARCVRLRRHGMAHKIAGIGPASSGDKCSMLGELVLARAKSRTV